MTISKFTGTGFYSNALLIDFLRDEEGNPLKTPNSFLVLHNPVRQKINELIEALNPLFGTLEEINGIIFLNGGPIGGTDHLDGEENTIYAGSFLIIDAGEETLYPDTIFTIDGGYHG